MNTSCFPCRWFSTIILLIVLAPKFDSVSLLGQTAFEPRVVQSEFVFIAFEMSFLTLEVAFTFKSEFMLTITNNTTAQRDMMAKLDISRAR